LPSASHAIGAEDIDGAVFEPDVRQVRSKAWYIIDSLVVRSLFLNDLVEVFLRRVGADAGFLLDYSQRPGLLVSIGLEEAIGLDRCKGAPYKKSPSSHCTHPPGFRRLNMFWHANSQVPLGRPRTRRRKCKTSNVACRCSGTGSSKLRVENFTTSCGPGGNCSGLISSPSNLFPNRQQVVEKLTYILRMCMSRLKSFKLTSLRCACLTGQPAPRSRLQCQSLSRRCAGSFQETTQYGDAAGNQRSSSTHHAERSIWQTRSCFA
jgi:hypothetical protein